MNFNIKTGVSMSGIEVVRKRKPKKLGKSCKYCHHYMPGYCMSFGIDISSTTNAHKCKMYTPKGSKSPDYPETQAPKKITNVLKLSVDEYIEFCNLPFDKSQLMEIAKKNKCDKLKKHGRIKFTFARANNGKTPKLVLRNKEIEIVVMLNDTIINSEVK